MSNTKHYKQLSLLFFWLGVICLLAPVAVYTVLGFVNGTITQKVSLGMMLLAALALTVINLLFKTHYRSAIWLIVIGIYTAMQNIMPLLLLVAAATIMDEFVFSPLHKKYKNLAIINKEIDKRL